MGAATTLSAPADQVEALIREVAAENDLAVSDQLIGLKPAQTGSIGVASVSSEKEDQLERRLAAAAVTIVVCGVLHEISIHTCVQVIAV